MARRTVRGVSIGVREQAEQRGHLLLRDGPGFDDWDEQALADSPVGLLEAEP